MSFNKQGSSGCIVTVEQDFAVKRGPQDWLEPEYESYQRIKAGLGSDFTRFYPECVLFNAPNTRLLILERTGVLTLEEGFSQLAKRSSKDDSNVSFFRRLCGIVSQVEEALWGLASKYARESSRDSNLFLEELRELIELCGGSIVAARTDFQFTCSPCHRDLGLHNIVVTDMLDAFKFIDPRASLSRKVKSSGAIGSIGWDLVCLMINLIRVGEIMRRGGWANCFDETIGHFKQRLLDTSLWNCQSIYLFVTARSIQFASCQCDFCKSHPYLAKLMEAELDWAIKGAADA
ncbi:MAG: hypothetical protein WAP74_04165 [Patescibacteria group bacterium]